MHDTSASTKYPRYLAESEVAKFPWGAALIEEMTGRKNNGNEDEAVGTWMEP